jgi:hypothetical protein
VKRPCCADLVIPHEYGIYTVMATGADGMRRLAHLSAVKLISALDEVQSKDSRLHKVVAEALPPLSSRAASETGMSISIFTATPIIQVVDETEDAEASHFNAKPRVSKRRPHLPETEGIENRCFRGLARIRLGHSGPHDCFQVFTGRSPAQTTGGRFRGSAIIGIGAFPLWNP